MLEKVQKKYRPQLPRLLTSADTINQDLVDVSQPSGSCIQSKPQNGLIASSATISNPQNISNAKPNFSRAQQLIKKSKIMTAQQKIKVSRFI